MKSKNIYKWCKARYVYYSHKVNKSIYELWDDVRIMLAKNDRVKGDYDFFATFMFWQCKRHEVPMFLVKLSDMDSCFCADKNYLYHPVNGVLSIEDYTIEQWSSTGDTWKTL